jgi:hypothetical protein
MDTRIKASFGTAIKFLDKKHPGHSAAMAIAAIAAFMLTPSTSTFLDGMRSREVWAGLHQRLLPKDRWFGVVHWPGRMVAHDAPTSETETKGGTSSSDLSTGSITRQPSQTQ